MQLTKKKTAIMALVLIAVFAAGVFASYVLLPPRYIYIHVEEAISIEPESVTVELLYPGESGTADFTVHNLASVDIPLIVSAVVTAFPEGGSAEDLTLTYSETLTAAASGDTILTIGFQLATGAVPGDYEITVSVTRI
jgi:hypothetical protein